MDNPSLNVVKDIYQQIENDPRTKGAVIEIGFDRGIVIFTGTVKSAEAMRALEEIARKQPGVIAVTNELKVG